jgi:hypothetical protein
VYLDEETITSAGLTGADVSSVAPGEKARVRLPASISERLLSKADLDAAVFLVRDGSTGTRLLSLDEAVKRCWDDITTGKTDQAVLDAVDADLRTLLADLRLHEFALDGDLDECYDGLRRLH